MNHDLQSDLMVALERSHRLGTIGGDLKEQLAHCASFSSLLAQLQAEAPDRAQTSGVDLGTGGGLPGLAIAASRPDMAWVLVEMRVARATEVERTALRLGIDDRCEVVASEAQNVGHDPRYREHFDIAVARAFGPPSVTAECATGVVAVGGVFVVSEPPADVTPDVADRWDVEGLHALGFGSPRLVDHDGARFAVMIKERGAPERIPRRPARSNRGWYRAST